METDLVNLCTAITAARVLIVGDAIMDRYFHGVTGGLCREAPVPVVSVSDWKLVPGGAANTAANVAALGAHATLLSVVGDDDDGSRLCTVLQAHGVCMEPVRHLPSRRTITKTRVISDNQMLVRFDEGTTGPLSSIDERQMIHTLIDTFAEADAVIVSDYGYGLCTPLMIQALRDLHARAPGVLVVDSRSQLRAFAQVSPTVVKPNYAEAVALVGGIATAGRSRAEQLSAEGARLLEITGAQLVAVTLDAEGAMLFEPDRPAYRTYAPPPQRATCPAGAGDTFVSALTLALVAGAHGPAAIEFASAASAVVVSKDGTAVCSSEEVRDYLSPKGKISDLHGISGRVAAYRRQGYRVVFTNGCFDLLHRGHISYLNHAKSLGDVLIVGVNSDASVRRLKGASRPINALADRLEVLAALSCIDDLVAFQGDSPDDLIEAIRPDVYVKGGDYCRETLPEAPLVEARGGRVVFLPYLQDQSTTGIIARIHQAASRTQAASEAVPGKGGKKSTALGPSSVSP